MDKIAEKILEKILDKFGDPVSDLTNERVGYKISETVEDDPRYGKWYDTNSMIWKEILDVIKSKITIK